MSDLDDLYQNIILDHNRRPRNYGPMPDATHKADGHNPLCGDEVTVFLHIEGDTIEKVSFDGQGCAISKASASLMTLRLKGRSIEDAKRAISEVRALLSGTEQTAPDLESMGDLAALAGVRKFAVRVKCATLAWHTLEAALAGRRLVSTEEN
ncbi:SUF system NifU family Fe-S cluster assembly protein [Opitutales bacterium ASA1]|uniref:Fe-S cluster assembly sulfur transfer protein SufU n=1 Tax=Congregicoccus parvus TaxID=3081749 RepID=UPI002B2F5C48|nr:SUF system NifU family Fe-S cluster assembly protein [Opitutales bacterium ASA1]